ncbi:MAG: ParB/RepB/Spo0J family partition protein [Bacilli bacterium]|nr:ParB/RepB/Spo0J family partition protein [Bacilli bacterium]
MAKKELEMSIPKISLDELFTTQKQRDEAKLEKVQNIPLDLIDEFPNHPFKVIDNDDMDKLVDSIKESNGVLVPTIVRKKDNGRYEMVSGHRRMRASQLLGLETIPSIVKNLTDDEATIIMVDSNIQREKLLPSEKAFAYKMKLDAMKHQGKSTSRQVGDKLKSADILGQDVGESGRQIQRYIRLTYLIPELLDMVDEEKIALGPAISLSYLNEDYQNSLLDYIQYFDATPSQGQANELKRLFQNNELEVQKIKEIMMKEKPNQVEKIKLDASRIREVLPRSVREDKIEDYVVKAIVHYEKYLKQKNLGAR